MKKLHFLCLASLLVLGWSAQGEAIAIRFEGPSGRMVSNNQLIEVIITDSQGHLYQQKIPYNSAMGGVDINIGELGPHASIYFPELGFGYIWYNGNWINEEGYYWDGQRRVYINDTNWKNYWTHYWQGNKYDKMRRGPWHQRSFGGRERTNSQYGNENYDSYRYRESNERRRGVWPERRGGDRRDQRKERQESQGNDRQRSDNRDLFNHSNQQNWENQGDTRNNKYGFEDQTFQNNWDDQTSTRGSQGGFREQTPGSGWGNQTSTSSQSSWSSQASTHNPASTNSNQSNLKGPSPFDKRANKLSANEEWSDWKAADSKANNDEKLSLRDDRPRKSNRWERRQANQQNQENQE